MKSWINVSLSGAGIKPISKFTKILSDVGITGNIDNIELKFLITIALPNLVSVSTIVVDPNFISISRKSNAKKQSKLTSRIFSKQVKISPGLYSNVYGVFSTKWLLSGDVMRGSRVGISMVIWWVPFARANRGDIRWIEIGR